ncbi:neutral zinc metallopeptidase [Lolliginicoccus suaedae]|uniref:neutral zinc metallopeptidase n=1 Tax=Lolliginicoccus suaedae TaxID=2605429 RepID=UPI0011ED5067|nr:neutral zinc metallopeptidase [Lolliginicoccus suaedae]
MASIDRWTAAVAACALAATACTATPTEEPAPLPVTYGPSGLRPSAPAPTVELTGPTSDDSADQLAAQALTDLGEFWADELEPADLSFAPYDGRSSSDTFCAAPTDSLGVAAYCPSSRTIGWDRTDRFTALIDELGPLAGVLVLAHEYGHAISANLGLPGIDNAPPDSATLLWEQQADCFAGTYLGSVMRDESPRFRMNTTDALDAVLATLLSVRDPSPLGEARHGSGFDRIDAFALGVHGGTEACASITARTIEHRQAGMPDQYAHALDRGELPVTEGTARLVVTSIAGFLEWATTPAISTEPASDCPDRSLQPPVEHCASTNYLELDLPHLRQGAEARDTARPHGDFSAFSIIALHAILAKEASNDLGATAVERALCLNGAWAAATAREETGRIYLSPGDLDEAITALLDPALNSLVAAAIPVGIARIDAFGKGFRGGLPACGHP